ncbi:MAG: thermonuclease family protein [Caldimonas sp.]
MVAGLLLAASFAASAALGDCKVAEAAHDGDGLKVTCTGRTSGLKLRLADIDAPELRAFSWEDQPGAAASRDALRWLCPVNSPVEVTLITFDKRTNRWIARATCNEVDASEYQALNGHAWAFLPRARSKVPALVGIARTGKLGLWADPNPVSPSVWRSKVCQ